MDIEVFRDDVKFQGEEEDCELDVKVFVKGRGVVRRFEESNREVRRGNDV